MFEIFGNILDAYLQDGIEDDVIDLDGDGIPDFEDGTLDLPDDGIPGFDTPEYDAGEYLPSFGGLSNTLDDIVHEISRPGTISDMTNVVNDKLEDLFSNEDPQDYSYLND